MVKIEKGQFVRVGNSIGVIVTLELEDEHIGVWYGELADSETPKYRTVPIAIVRKGISEVKQQF